VAGFEVLEHPGEDGEDEHMPPPPNSQGIPMPSTMPLESRGVLTILVNYVVMRLLHRSCLDVPVGPLDALLDTL